jgi:hypothetical protein
MSRPALIPYVGQPRRASGKPYTPPGKFEVVTSLDAYREAQVAELFAAGHDTVAIAKHLRCTPASAANALSRIRDAGR